MQRMAFFRIFLMYVCQLYTVIIKVYYVRPPLCLYPLVFARYLNSLCSPTRMNLQELKSFLRSDLVLCLYEEIKRE